MTLSERLSRSGNDRASLPACHFSDPALRMACPGRWVVVAEQCGGALLGNLCRRGNGSRQWRMALPRAALGAVRAFAQSAAG